MKYSKSMKHNIITIVQYPLVWAHMDTVQGRIESTICNKTKDKECVILKPVTLIRLIKRDTRMAMAIKACVK
jgi:hypothetical protein